MGKSGCCRNVSDRSSRELVTDLDCIRVDKCRRVVKVDNSHFSLLFSVIFSSLDIFVRARKRPSLDARLITPARRFISISRVAHTTFFFQTRYQPWNSLLKTYILHASVSPISFEMTDGPLSSRWNYACEGKCLFNSRLFGFWTRDKFRVNEW